MSRLLEWLLLLLERLLGRKVLTVPDPTRKATFSVNE